MKRPGLPDFLSSLWADLPGSRCVSTVSADDQRAKAREPKHKVTTWKDAFFETTEEAAAFAASVADSRAVYVAAGTFSDPSGGRRKNNAAATAAVWVDLDFGTEGHRKEGPHTTEADARRALDAAPFHPSALIHTGGGLSAFWLLREPVDLADGGAVEVETVNRALADLLGGDSVSDCVHVMRAPDSKNWKHDPPRPSELLMLEPDRRFNLSDFGDFLDLDRFRNGASAARPAASAPGIGGELAARVAALPPITRAVVSLDLAGYKAEAKARGWREFPSRSDRDFAAVRYLVRNRWSDAEILEAFEALPVGERFREKGPADLTRSLAKIRATEADRPPEGPQEGEAPAPPATDAGSGGWADRLIRKGTPEKPGALERSVHNALVILEDHPEWRGVLAFDTFSHRVTVRKRPPYRPASFKVPDKGLPWTDDDDTRAAAWLHERFRLMLGVDVIHNAAVSAARRFEFHPVREYLEGLKWDGKPRLDSWLSDFLRVKDSPYSRAVGARWFISGVARAYRPGAKADHVLILEGPQGCGKSTALRALAGGWFTDELDALGSKDAAGQLLGVWIVELSELDALGRAEISRTKAFMSKSFDRYRPPYGRNVEDFPRQCIFAGSVNHASYLRDETGNRRFWPVTCQVPEGQRLDVAGLEAVAPQLWAEAVVMFKGGAKWWLDSAALTEAAGKEQADRFEEDIWAPVIAEFVDGREEVTIGEVLTKLGVETSRQGQTEKNRVARTLQHMGWIRRRVRRAGGRTWVYEPPASPLDDVSPDKTEETGDTKTQRLTH